MKVGLVCPYNMFRGGGVQEVILALAKGLEDRGHQVRVISPRPRGFDGEIPADHILLGTSADVRTFSTTPSLSISVDNEEIETMLTREEFDILHFHEPWVPMLSRQILSRSTCVNVATVHAKLPESIAVKTLTSVINPYVKSVIKNIDVFSAVSEAAAEYLHSVEPDMEVNIIPNGISLQKYSKQPYQSKAGSPTILFLGRLEKRKGVRYLLKAFAALRTSMPEARLLIAGDGSDSEKLQEMAHELRIASHVKFLGFVDERQKIKLLASSTVFCSPALYGESFGIVLLEAMAVGVPTVAGSNPGYESVMKGNGRMSLVDPKDSDELARRLELFIKDGDMRQLWRDWAAEYVQQFDYAKIVDQYEAFYARALRQHR